MAIPIMAIVGDKGLKTLPACHYSSTAYLRLLLLQCFRQSYSSHIGTCELYSGAFSYFYPFIILTQICTDCSRQTVQMYYFTFESFALFCVKKCPANMVSVTGAETGGQAYINITNEPECLNLAGRFEDMKSAVGDQRADTFSLPHPIHSTGLEQIYTNYNTDIQTDRQTHTHSTTHISPLVEGFITIRVT